MLVLQVTNTGVRRPGYEATPSAETLVHGFLLTLQATVGRVNLNGTF